MIHYTFKTEKDYWLADVLISESGIITAVTDFGNFALKFNDFGDDFNEFILSLDIHYFGNKIVQQGNYDRETAMFISVRILPIIQKEIKKIEKK